MYFPNCTYKGNGCYGERLLSQCLSKSLNCKCKCEYVLPWDYFSIVFVITILFRFSCKLKVWSYLNNYMSIIRFNKITWITLINREPNLLTFTSQSALTSRLMMCYPCRFYQVTQNPHILSSSFDILHSVLQYFDLYNEYLIISLHRAWAYVVIEK